ncbi:MAG: DUF6464 family protein [Cyanobium sp.]
MTDSLRSPSFRLELRHIEDDRLIARLDAGSLAEIPHPGRWLALEEGHFLVVQRRHRYRLCNGRYELNTVDLQVRPQRQPADARWWNGRWVIGDPNCLYNARSPLLRCAVLPEGPCDRCSHFQGTARIPT